MKIILIICSIFIIIFIYKLISYLYIIRLQSRLQNGSLQTFKEVLGQHYYFKEQTTGLTRYKWVKGWITIRADFDEEGKLCFTEMESIKPLRLLSSHSFSSQ